MMTLLSAAFLGNRQGCRSFCSRKAAAGALDTLLMFGVRLIIPDMVEFEVVRHLDKPGARQILSWIADHKAQGVVIGEAQEYKEFRILIEHDPKIKIRNRGELAAGEILFNEIENGVDAAILLFEDSDIKKTNFLVRLPDKVLVMSTSTFLDGLQQKGLIKSANEILERATKIRSEGLTRRDILGTEGAEELIETLPYSVSP